VAVQTEARSTCTTAYERFWHWLQTFTIILLLFTGLVIHRPDMFGIFSFRHMVTLHNMLAFVLVINAALALFWHVVGGQIRQFIPRPATASSTRRFCRPSTICKGIFRDDEHPFDKELSPPSSTRCSR
jgi:Ni,Fe-hydrogenase I cytochrome b subunit